MSPRVVLKVDVDTYSGTLDGVPRLLELFTRHGVRATFFFSLGPDNTGKAVKRVFRKGFVKKVLRASPGASYGIRTMRVIVTGGVRRCASAADAWIFRTTSMPRVTRPNAAKPCPSRFR